VSEDRFGNYRNAFSAAKTDAELRSLIVSWMSENPDDGDAIVNAYVDGQADPRGNRGAGDGCRPEKPIVDDPVRLHSVRPRSVRRCSVRLRSPQATQAPQAPQAPAGWTWRSIADYLEASGVSCDDVQVGSFAAMRGDQLIHAILWRAVGTMMHEKHVVDQAPVDPLAADGRARNIYVTSPRPAAVDETHDVGRVDKAERDRRVAIYREIAVEPPEIPGTRFNRPSGVFYQHGPSGRMYRLAADGKTWNACDARTGKALAVEPLLPVIPFNSLVHDDGLDWRYKVLPGEAVMIGGEIFTVGEPPTVPTAPTVPAVSKVEPSAVEPSAVEPVDDEHAAMYRFFGGK
jgi:hypothetical protein